MALTEIQTSSQTRGLADQFEELHREGRVFEKKGVLSRDPEVERRARPLAESATIDVKRHLGLASHVIIKTTILFNLAMLLEICSFEECGCQYFIITGGKIYYAGFIASDACA